MLVFFAMFSGSTLFATGIIYPVANFTLRSTDNGLGASEMDATPDGSGFDGFMTVSSGEPQDRVYAEFNVSQIPSSWTSIALTFSTTGIGPINPSTVQVSYYLGTGSPELSDWTVSTTQLTTIPGVAGPSPESFTINVTSVVDSFEGRPGFLGFRFALDDSPISQTDQKILQASSIELEQVPEPSTGLLGLFGFGVLLAARGRSRLMRFC